VRGFLIGSVCGVFSGKRCTDLRAYSAVGGKNGTKDGKLIGAFSEKGSETDDEAGPVGAAAETIDSDTLSSEKPPAKKRRNRRGIPG